MSFRIGPPARRMVDDRPEISAEVAGQQLWFRLPPGHPGELRGEPFLAASIVPAMRRGEPLELDPALPVCPAFLEGVQQFMDVFRFWGPALGLRLRPVEVLATEQAAPPSDGVATFFSGGIDGLYTLLTSEHPVSTAVFVHGIDFQLDNPMAHEAVRRNREWLAGRGVTLVEVESNVRFVGTELGVRWNQHNGACLAALGHALGSATTLVASTYSWEFTRGHGTHPVSDPLLSSATRRVVHHGYGPKRWQKLARVAEAPGVLELLRVCWQDREYNCGQCEKCRRTMLLLELLELEAPTFPRRPARDLVPDRIGDAESFYYVRQALGLARDRGRVEVAALLERRMKAWHWRRVLRELDDTFLGGRIDRLRRTLAR